MANTQAKGVLPTLNTLPPTGGSLVSRVYGDLRIDALIMELALGDAYGVRSHIQSSLTSVFLTFEVPETDRTVPLEPAIHAGENRNNRPHGETMGSQSQS